VKNGRGFIVQGSEGHDAQHPSHPYTLPMIVA